MKKNPLLMTGALCLISIFLIRCNKTENINSFEYADTQIINLAIYRDFNYDLEDSKPDKNAPSRIDGNIYANRLPELLHIKSGNLYLVQGSGLSTAYDENLLSIYGSSNRIPTSDFEISTTIGIVQGNVVEPYIKVTPTINFEDSLEQGQPIQLDWTGASADFFNVYCVLSAQGSPAATILDTLITDEQLTLPPSILEPAFEVDSSTVEIQVAAINGPYSDTDVVSNLTGDGSGFLYRFIVCRTINLIMINNIAYQNKNSLNTRSNEAITENLLDKLFDSN